MGSNASKSTSAYSVVRNYSTILRNGNAFKLGDLDVSERHLLLELRIIILLDEIILDVILFHSFFNFLARACDSKGSDQM